MRDRSIRKPKRKKRSNPLTTDPSRTGSLRRSLEATLNRYLDESLDAVIEDLSTETITGNLYDLFRLTDQEIIDNNCGIGPGGFLPGNTCATGGNKEPEDPSPSDD